VNNTPLFPKKRIKTSIRIFLLLKMAWIPGTTGKRIRIFVCGLFKHYGSWNRMIIDDENGLAIGAKDWFGCIACGKSYWTEP